MMAFVAYLAGASGALHAQATKIFVASFGSDANDGSRGSPKRNFQAAHDAVAASGQIVVLDTAGYGALSINKSVSVTVPPGVNGFVSITGDNNAITVNAATTDRVVLRGLVIEGNTQSGGVGIRGNSVGTLIVEDCTVRNLEAGVFFVVANNARLILHNCVVRDCLGALFANTTAAVTLNGSLTGCRIEQNTTGVAAGGVASSVIRVALEDCIISGHQGNGIPYGIVAGAQATVIVSRCTITGNANGVRTSDNGVILSRGNNTLEKNAAGNFFQFSFNAK
jgi:hypothetical protein